MRNVKRTARSGLVLLAALGALAAPVTALADPNFGGYGGLCAQSGGYGPGCAQEGSSGGPNPIWMLIGKALGVNRTQPAASPAAQKAYELNEQGIAANRAGNPELAVSLFQQALTYQPNDAVIRDNLNTTEGHYLNQAAITAHRAGDLAAAVNLFRQAWQYDPGDVTIRNNLRNAEDQLRALQADQAAAAKIRGVISGYAPTAIPVADSGGLAFGSGSASPATGVAAQGGQAVQPGQPTTPPGQQAASSDRRGDQLNKGADTDEARAMRSTSYHNAGALGASSAAGQLRNGTGNGAAPETLGQMYNGGRSPDDDTAEATVRARPVTPQAPAAAAAAPEQRLAQSPKYQAAMAELTRAKAAEQPLSARMSALLADQAANPTPERQREIFELSGPLKAAHDSVDIALTKVDTEKKIILLPPKFVDDDPGAGSGKGAANGTGTGPKPIVVPPPPQ